MLKYKSINGQLDEDILMELKLNKEGLKEYINTFYNTVRIHSHCNYMSPNDYEKLYQNSFPDQFCHYYSTL